MPTQMIHVALGLIALAFIVLFIARIRGNTRTRLPLGISAVGLFAGLQLKSDLLLTAIGLSEEHFSTSEKLIASGFWLAVAYAVNAVIKNLIYDRLVTEEGDVRVPRLVQHLITLLIYLLAAMAIMSLVYGQSITTLLAASGAVALVLGYSARTLIDEVFAGLALNIDAPFKKGDLIQLNNEWGYIKEIDWRSITYLDMDNNYVTVPNSVVAASSIRNLDNPSRLTRRTMFFRVEYNVPPKIVVDECNAAMAECPHVAPHPWNFTSFFEFDEKGMRYKLHFYIHHYDDWYVASDELINSIWYRFARKGIRFAHQRNLNFTNSDDEQRGLPDSAWDDASWRVLMKKFREVPMFEGMTREDMEELARSATAHIVGPPERIIRAGSKRTSMFVIASGEADVFEVDEDGNETFMDTVGEGETLGLMSLLTGVPQRTTIRAKEEAIVWEIDSDSLHQLFERKPEVMAEIADNVARWQVEEQAAIDTIAQQRSLQKAMQERSSRLSGRIKKFFQGQSEDDKKSSEYTGY